MGILGQNKGFDRIVQENSLKGIVVEKIDK